MLTVDLRGWDTARHRRRTVYNRHGTHVTYALTPMGKHAACKATAPLIDWSACSTYRESTPPAPSYGPRTPIAPRAGLPARRPARRVAHGRAARGA